MQRPNWLAEDAVRSETVSRADLPAIYDLQGDFQKLQGEPILLPVKFPNDSRCCKSTRDVRSREKFLDIAGKSSVELRMVAGWARGQAGAECRAQIRRHHARERARRRVVDPGGFVDYGCTSMGNRRHDGI
jgi:hypothetical protein